MLKNDISVTSVCWRQQGTFLGRLWDVPSSAINIKKCNGFKERELDFCDGESST